MFPSDNNFETHVDFEKNSNPIANEKPFKILFLGDWSGRTFSEKSTSPSLNSDPIEIDRDNFEEVLEKFQIKLNLDLKNDPNNSVSIDIKNFDDFHPDTIFQQLPYFSHLRDIRRRLLNPDTFNNAANEVRSWLGHHIEENKDKKDLPQDSHVPIDSENLLDLILSENSDLENSTKIHKTPKSDLNILISKLVKPFIVQTDENEQTNLLKVVDEVTGDLMREILHHPHFQTMESAWRGLFFLVKRIETNTNLKLFIYDIGKANLSNHLKSFDYLTDSEFYNLITGKNNIRFGEKIWSFICANYEFTIDVPDTALLMRLAKISSDGNAPFISYLNLNSIANKTEQNSFKFLFDPPNAELWDSLRSIPESSYLGFAFPRFLARLPYCEDAEPLETFSFDELKSSFLENKYTWINPVFGCAYLLARSFSLNGWEMADNFQFQIDDLPFFTYQENNQINIQNSLEFTLNQNECINLMDLGIMTFIAFQNSDFIRLTRFQSISNTSFPLNGLL